MRAILSMLAAGGILAVAMGSAAAQPADSCAATINGADPAGLTRDHPLVVHEGQDVEVSGSVPTSARSVAENDLHSVTKIAISVVEGVADVSSSGHPGKGYTWGGKVNVDRLLTYGVGLYHVEGVATGTGGWSCSTSGYVKLDGDPLSKPIGQTAALAIAIGALGILVATRARKKDRPAASPDRGTAALADAAVVLVWIVVFIGGFVGAGAAAAVVTAEAPRPAPGRVWVRGHAVLGFFAGLVFGAGATVLAQQYALWPLTVLTAFAVPVLTGIVGAVRAWKGQPFRALG